MQENQPDKNKKSDDIEEAKVSESDVHDNANDSLNNSVTPSHIEPSSKNEIEDCLSKPLETPSSQLDQIMPESTFENSISIGNLHDQYNFYKYKGQYEPKNYKDVSELSKLSKSYYPKRQSSSQQDYGYISRPRFGFSYSRDMSINTFLNYSQNHASDILPPNLQLPLSRDFEVRILVKAEESREKVLDYLEQAHEFSKNKSIILALKIILKMIENDYIEVVYKRETEYEQELMMNLIQDNI